jgi:large subunit ribosomal protein L15
VRAHELSPVPGPPNTNPRRGRATPRPHGTYSTRGIKGQQSRSGPDLRIGFEGGQIPLVRALSRKRGFNNRFRIDYEAINVSDLAKLPAGSDVTSESLRAAGIVKSARQPVKLLGDGEIKVKLNVTVEKISAGAKAKIEAAGGKATALVAAREKEAPEEKAEPKAAAPAKAPAAEATAEEPKAEAPAAPAAEEQNEEPAAEAKPARRPRAPRAKASEETDNATTET